MEWENLKDNLQGVEEKQGEGIKQAGKNRVMYISIEQLKEQYCVK